jgi:hypothetical protein
MEMQIADRHGKSTFANSPIGTIFGEMANADKRGFMEIFSMFHCRKHLQAMYKNNSSVK